MAKQRTLGKSKDSKHDTDVGDVLRDGYTKAIGKNKHPGVSGLEVSGIKLNNCLPLQYILGVDVFPLERSVKIIGAPGAGKSQFVWWLLTQFFLHEAVVIWIETEGKTSPAQIKAIVQNPVNMEKRVIEAPVTSLEECLYTMQHFAEAFLKRPDRHYPFVIFVDSLSYLAGDDSIEAMRKTGVAGVGFGSAHDAKTVTDQMKAFTGEYMRGQPITLFTIHHQKGKMGETAFGAKGPTDNTGSGGGLHMDFGSTFTIQVRKTASTSENVEESVSTLYFQVIKNALNIDNRRCDVSVRSKHIAQEIPEGEDPEDYPPIQKITYDWDAALIKLLTKEKSPISKKWKTFLNLTVDAKKAWGTTFGIPKDEPITHSEMGKLIHADPVIVQKLQVLMRIDVHNVFTPDTYPPPPKEEKKRKPKVTKS